jgi:hypothetical protein
MTGRGRGGATLVPQGHKVKSSEGSEPPPLYPPLNIPEPLKLDSKDRYMLRKNASLRSKMINSPYFFQPKASFKKGKFI